MNYYINKKENVNYNSICLQIVLDLLCLHVPPPPLNNSLQSPYSLVVITLKIYPVITIISAYKDNVIITWSMRTREPRGTIYNPQDTLLHCRASPQNLLYDIFKRISQIIIQRIHRHSILLSNSIVIPSFQFYIHKLDLDLDPDLYLQCLFATLIS